MKLVVDTNVLISGLLWRGNPSLLVDAVLDGKATLCSSPALLDELEEVLNRPKFVRRLAEKQLDPSSLISDLRSSTLILDVTSIPIPSALRDPDDIHVLACAVSASADVIISGDDDLLCLIEFHGISILRVVQGLEKLGIPFI